MLLLAARVGDYFTAKGARGAPHDAALIVWHDIAQASATSAVIIGDKTKPEEYKWANSGHVLDLGEPRQGKGGTDRIIELKAYNSLVSIDASPDPSCSFKGDTHAFGNTEEALIRRNVGVVARTGLTPWSNSTGVGVVRAHDGAYHDAIHTKRNEFWLVIHNIFGGLNPVGVKLFQQYAERAKHGDDRTDYAISDSNASSTAHFAPHWSQLLSSAVVTADARRSLRAVDACRDACMRASTRRVLATICPPPPPAGP